MIFFVCPLREIADIYLIAHLRIGLFRFVILVFHSVLYNVYFFDFPVLLNHVNGVLSSTGLRGH